MALVPHWNDHSCTPMALRLRALIARRAGYRAPWRKKTAREDGNAPMTKIILIADDEEFIVDLLATLLEDEGYTIARAYDGEQALAEARQSPPNLIITDIMMPRMNGIELARRIRAQEAGGRQTPIILMSAVTNAVAIPGTIYLPKPFDIDHVLELVNRLLPR